MKRLSNKRFLVAAFGFVLLASWSGWRLAFGVVMSADQQLQARPRIEISEKVWDFGNVTQATELEAIFTVRNVGRRRLLLVEQSSGCDGCMPGGNPEVSILPGGERTLKIVLDTSRIYGATKAQYHFRTNDPDRPKFTLAIIADIQPESHEVNTTQLTHAPSI